MVSRRVETLTRPKAAGLIIRGPHLPDAKVLQPSLVTLAFAPAVVPCDSG